MGREIVWCENVRYLGVHVVSSRSFTCSLSKYGCIFSDSFWFGVVKNHRKWRGSIDYV